MKPTPVIDGPASPWNPLWVLVNFKDASSSMTWQHYAFPALEFIALGLVISLWFAVSDVRHGGTSAYAARMELAKNLACVLALSAIWPVSLNIVVFVLLLGLLVGLLYGFGLLLSTLFRPLLALAARKRP